MPLIELKSVSKIYPLGSQQVVAIDDLSLSVDAGEFTVLAGPSGSGKTTALNLIGCLDAPSRGEVWLDGQEVGQAPQRLLAQLRLEKIGFIFQAYNLIPVLTAKENVEFIMQLQKWDKKKMDERTINLLHSVGLQDKIHSRPNQLSGGQQQRVAVARALASKPKFVLADEPTANLDSSATGQLLDIMERLNREENITFIFATHDQRVMDKARRVISLDDGKVVSDLVKGDPS
jgi:putative ABC transport system ATP-binding protein